MSTVAVSIDIAAPAATVWEFAMDPGSTLEWVTIVRAVSDVDDGPLRRGFRMHQTLALRGVPFRVAWTLVEMRAPHFARWEGRGPARSTAVIEDTLRERDGVTNFHYANTFRAPFGPLGAVASHAMVGGIPEKEAIASLERLKQRLENAAE
ncbi:MAG: hypothetical protein AVDCRST_MAG38-2407 [uncultured Solirubrobacteraceae bacterium]|uniref:Polyketide cyclase/dehydrase n=1 Tax=uncultured Solirubrobacteraceae bacterium TaxID=1162706 RepID=A0A6J4SA19_9ACTN|nr:MAG: hypothetical protein AVDCRST_MAG38-2407 [uncultured Solirubrobacteraceae bacterium]